MTGADEAARLGLTGATMDAADAIYAGFADHMVPSERIDSSSHFADLQKRFEHSSDRLLLLWGVSLTQAPIQSDLQRARQMQLKLVVIVVLCDE